MISFKECRAEGRVNWGTYGSWINAKTKEVLDVPDESHEKVMISYLKDKGLPVPKPVAFANVVSDGAIRNGWVRLIHGWDTAQINGGLKEIKMIIPMIRKRIQKSWVYLDVVGNSKLTGEYYLADRDQRKRFTDIFK